MCASTESMKETHQIKLQMRGKALRIAHMKQTVEIDV